MESLKVDVHYQLFAKQSIIWTINGVVSLDTPSAFVQTICVFLEIETLLIFLKPARSLAFDLCPFFPEPHLLTSFLRGYLTGDYLLALALQFRIKRNTHEPTRMVVHRSHFCISSSCPSLFQWWLLVLPLWLWLSLRLCGRTWLLRTSTFPVNTLSQFSHAIFSSREHHSPKVLGRCMFLCTTSFQLRWRVKLKGSYILAIFLWISLWVTLTIGAGKAPSNVSTVLFHGLPSSLVSPIFTPI